MAGQQPRPARPAWLSLIQRPAVLQVLAALHHHGPHGFHPLCAYVAPGRNSTAGTSSAIRRLATFGLLRCRGQTGSLDEPDPATLYELTDRGHQFARAWFEIDRLITEHQRADQRRT